MAESLMIALVCDCDPDRPRYGGVRYDKKDSRQSWRGISEGIHLLRQVLEKINLTSGLRPKLVFCLRSDKQMKEIYGDASWPIGEYADLWRLVEREGHELAWHPHLWRWSNESECWYQETQDEQWIAECLDEGYAGFVSRLGKGPVTCHSGWTFHNNVTMRKISKLGLKVDFSACPGVLYDGGPGSGGTIFDNKVDWTGTPIRWYRPSAIDYRRPALEGEPELTIAEIPKFTTQSSVLKMVKSLASRGKKSSDSGAPTAVFLQITSLPILYRRVIRERLASREAGPFFATYFHPDELLTDRPRSARNFLYSVENMEKNLTDLIHTARQQNRKVSFVTGAEASEYLRTQEAN